MSRMYRFRQFHLDPRRRTLSRASVRVPLTSKAFDVLVFLVQNPNRIVSKEELLQAVWGDTLVEEGNLTQYISHLRKALGDNAEDPRLIVTVARKGYQFAGDVVSSDEPDTAMQIVGKFPGTASPRRDTQLDSDLPRVEAIARTPRSSRRNVVLASLVFILALIGYLCWHHFRLAALPRTERIRLAVLPFENLTGDSNQDYLADGLTEETISQLGRLDPDHLGVIARSSVMRYKQGSVHLDQIGRDLSVQYVLENSLRENGDHIRLSAQLIEVKNQTQLWSQEYDYSLKDVLKVEEDVAKAVAREIQLRLTSQQQTEFLHPPPVNSAAFDAYLRGYYFFERSATDKDTEMAGKYFERATQLDPGYALAWVGLSRARYWRANIGSVPPQEGQRLAREAVERALSIDPKLAEAHSQMARIQRQVDYDWTGASASIHQAIALAPGIPENLVQAAFMAEIFGRFDEALKLGHEALELDPLNAASWETLAENEFYAGQSDKAVADIRKALELNPDTWGSPIQLGEIYVMQGRFQDALRESEQMKLGPFRIKTRAIAYNALGREKESDAALSELVEKYHGSAAFSIAMVYAYRNERDEAFEWLERAYAQHDAGVIYVKIDPLLRNLRGDPRYGAFLKKLHMPT